MSNNMINLRIIGMVNEACRKVKESNFSEKVPGLTEVLETLEGTRVTKSLKNRNALLERGKVRIHRTERENMMLEKDKE